MRQQEIRPHQHDGPRTGQTASNEWVMTCERCGVQFVAGLEDMPASDVKEMMEILNPTED